MRLLKWFFSICFAVFFLINCTDKNKLDVDTSKIPVALDLSRFDAIFFNTKPQELPKVKEEFSYLFPANVPDSIWLAKIKNPDSRYLFEEAQKVFPNFNKESQELSQLFKHVKYYFPKFKAPKIVTLISDIDYNNKVIYADSLLLISLDMYLGKNHEVYQNFPKYVKNSYTKEQLKVDVAREIALISLPKNKLRTFISRCIQQGKLLYTIKAFIPNLKDSTLMNYPTNKMLWAINNQEFVWRYFVENNLLFNTDRNISKRFLDDAPFSKFYLANDKDSPGRIGAFIGYKIVDAYLKNNDKNLIEMLTTPNDLLYKQSKYKPKN
jgi:gliding motility-associated lipoprotein GldB